MSVILVIPLSVIYFPKVTQNVWDRKEQGEYVVLKISPEKSCPTTEWTRILQKQPLINLRFKHN